MLGRRLLNLELLPLDPDLKRVFKRKRRAPVERESVEMGDNMNVEQPRGENEQPSIATYQCFVYSIETNSASCIVLPPTNATHFDLKPHVI
jgi:hypothetical protein